MFYDLEEGENGFLSWLITLHSQYLPSNVAARRRNPRSLSAFVINEVDLPPGVVRFPPVKEGLGHCLGHFHFQQLV